jgi:hypothetical protein
MAQIKGYRISYFSSSNQPFVAEIRLWDDPNNNTEESQIGSIRFCKSGTTIPTDFHTENGRPVVYYELSRFNDVVTILRDENYAELLQVFYETIGVSVAGYAVMTGPEETGDMEVNRRQQKN